MEPSRLHEGETPSKRPRPAWNPIWNVNSGSEDDFGEALHNEDKKPNHAGTNLFGNAKDHLDDWDTMLLASPLNAGDNPAVLMNNTKVFFMSCGFTSPRSTVCLTEDKIDRLLKYATKGDNPSIFAPQTIREELGISQVINLAKAYQDLEWQAVNCINSAANKKSDEHIGHLENSTLNALSMLGVGPQAMKVMQIVNAVKVTSHGIPKIMAGASLGDMSKLPIEFFPSTDVYSLLLTDNRAAVEAGRQALTYFNLCDNAFIPPWLPPDAVGGVSQHIKVDLLWPQIRLRKTHSFS